VIVLILFGLMLTRAPIGRTALDRQQRRLAAPATLLLFGVTATILWRAFEGQRIDFGSERASLDMLGQELFTRFVMPFEIASVLLLAALVGAVFLAKKD
jgi:NADH-quinone oxidoreductase subunit J